MRINKPIQAPGKSGAKKHKLHYASASRPGITYLFDWSLASVAL